MSMPSTQDSPAICGFDHLSMASMTEKLIKNFFKFYLTLIHPTLNRHMWLAATVLDSPAPE